MNWLIIYTPQFHSSKNAICNFLESLKIQNVFFAIEHSFLQEPLAWDTNIKIAELCEQIKKADFIVYMAREDEMLSPFCMYVLGFLAAFEIPFAVIGSEKKPLFFKTYTEVFFYKTIGEFAECLKDTVSKIQTKKGNAKAQKKLCEMGLALNIDSFAQVIKDKNTSLTDLYLSLELDINARDSLGTPLLNIATRAENIEIVEKLLEKSVSISEKSQDRGYTALMDAVWKSSLPLVKLLIEAGSDVNHIADDGQSILVLATGIDNYDICECLINAGANCHVKDKMGMSALDYARLFHKEKLIYLYEKVVL